MKQLQMIAPAKINLSLDVLGKLPNGYHALDMIMQSIELCDDVFLSLQAEISLECVHPGVPCDSRNIAWKAATAFFETTRIEGGVAISLKKRIPAAAGLAGGSTDAAAVLMGLNHLYESPLSEAQLATLALTLGADVPFCLKGGTCRAEGIGEKLTPIIGMKDLWVVLVKPAFSLSTATVFGQYRKEAVTLRPQTERLIQAITEGDMAYMAHNMCNVLESVSCRVHPEILTIIEKMHSLGALGSRMSGSGPTVFGLFERETTAQAAAEMFSRDCRNVFVVKIGDGGVRHG